MAIKKFNTFLNEKKWAKDVHPKKGKMHDVLGIPEDKKISDVYTSGKELAEDLVKKVGKKKAASMIDFVANVSNDEPIFKTAQKELSEIKENLQNKDDIEYPIIDEYPISNNITLVSIENEVEYPEYKIQFKTPKGIFLVDARKIK